MEQRCFATYQKEKSLARGGQLYIKNGDVRFEPHVIDRILFAKELIIPASRIREARFVRANMFGNEEFVICTNDGVAYKFLVRDSKLIITDINKLVSINSESPVVNDAATRVIKKEKNKWQGYIFSIFSLCPIIASVFFAIKLFVRAALAAPPFNNRVFEDFLYQNMELLTVAVLVLTAYTMISIIQILSLNTSDKNKFFHCLNVIFLGLLYIPLLQFVILPKLRAAKNLEKMKTESHFWDFL